MEEQRLFEILMELKSGNSRQEEKLDNLDKRLDAMEKENKCNDFASKSDVIEVKTDLENYKEEQKKEQNDKSKFTTQNIITIITSLGIALLGFLIKK